MKLRTIILSMVAASVTATMAEAPVAIANVQGAASWQSMQNPPYGMYSFPLSQTPAVTHIADNVVPANFGSVRVGNKYFVIEGIATSIGSFVTNYLYDINTWQKITDFRGQNLTAFDMAWDQMTDRVYGAFHNFDTGEEFFGMIDIHTGATTIISPLSRQVRAMDFDTDGTLYAIDLQGALLKVDTTTGVMTVVGQSGATGKWTTSGAIDPATSTFYYVACTDTASTIYAIDLATAQATTVGTLPDEMEISGMYLPEPSALPAAPAAPADLALDFPAGALSGSITFTVPAHTFDGTPATGSLTAMMTVNGVNVYSQQVTYGQSVSVPYAVSQRGEAAVALRLTNDAGTSPTTRLDAWIGPDTPAKPAYMDITYDGNGTFSLAWPEMTAAHGGWYDPAQASYSVVRYGDATQRFDNLNTNTLTDYVGVPYEDEYATYHYEVATRFGNDISSYTSSEYYTIGSRVPPFSEPFNARWDLGKFTIFEGANSDDDRWSYDNKAVTVGTYTDKGGDDYLLLPPLELEKGKVYTITFDVKGKYASDTERLEVLAGMAPTIDALTETVMPPYEFADTSYRTVTMEFAPPSDGVWFIALHAISDPWKGGITVDNISVGAGVTSVGHNIADGVSVTAGTGLLRIDAPGQMQIGVASMTGHVIYCGTADSHFTLPLDKGIYVVAVNGVTYKINIY